jgi:alpha-ketoglutarate-dependent taurine dioxygenase
MKKIYICLLALSFAAFACNNKPAEENTEKPDTTVVIHKYEEPAKMQESPEKPHVSAKKPEVKKEPVTEKKTINWRPVMEEYHEVLCRRNKGQSEPNDAIRQVELTKQLNDAREELPKEEKFEFATAMARAANMASCK